MLTERMPKRLDLLSQLVPQAGVIALLVNPNNAIVAEPMIRNMQEAARAKGLQLHIVKAGTESEIQAVYATQLHDGALVIGPDPLFDNRSEQLVAMSARYAIPTIYVWRDFAAAGGLISYGPASIRKPGSPMCCVASSIIRLPGRISYRPGTRSNPKSLPPSDYPPITALAGGGRMVTINTGFVARFRGVWGENSSQSPLLRFAPYTTPHARSALAR
jgi:hypothetical protein